MIGLKHKVRGAFTVETSISLTIFMLAVLALMMISMLIRIQADMQYAANQTAKEISGYFYLVDKLGLASVLSGHENAAQAEKLEKMDTTISHIVEFAGSSKEDFEDLKGQFSEGFSMEDVSDFQNLVQDAQNNADKLKELKNKAETVSKDLEGAQSTIEILRMLREKTKGNLTGSEEKLLNDTIAALQENYEEEAGDTAM